MPLPRPFNFGKWIDEHAHLLKPPVGNKLVFEKAGMVVMVVGGPNQRVDFHDDPEEEFFYQLRGDMVLKVIENGEFATFPFGRGMCFCFRRMSVTRRSGRCLARSGWSWRARGGARSRMVSNGTCFGCGNRLHRVEVGVKNIVTDLPPLFAAFYADTAARTCKQCGAVHPGKEPPAGWVNLAPA